MSIETASGKIASGQQFLGLLMGEHSKCSIGTRFNTGTVVGTSSNIFGNGMPAKYIPSFSWGDGHTGNGQYQADKAVETARKVMARRKIKMNAGYEAMLRAVAGESE